MKKTLILVHGSKEHIGRYKEFIDALERKGINVIAKDLKCHGKNLNDSFHNFSFEDILNSTLDMIDNSMKNTDNSETYIMGHSFGSFIIKYIIYNNLRTFDGVILSGTNHMSNNLINLAISLTSKGDKNKVNKLLEFMSFGVLGIKSLLHNGSKRWLSKSKENNESYKNDPLCGKHYSKQSLNTVFKFMRDSKQDNTLSNFNDKNINQLIIYGKKDPVNNFGKEIKKLTKSYDKFKISNYSVIEYKNSRHEIIFDIEKEKVIGDIIEFIKTNS